MQITAVRLTHVRIPLHEPFAIAGGRVREKDAIVVEVCADDGTRGWGEASPMAGSFYSAETPESTWNALASRLIPTLLRTGSLTPEGAATVLAAGNDEPFARAGLEGAMWDLAARRRGTPLHALLGGSARPVPCGLAVGLMPDTEALCATIARYLPDGYQRLKIKIQPGWDEEPLRTVRARFGDIPLMVDANASYRWNEHAALLRRLDAFDLMMIEQPLPKDALDDLAAMQRTVHTPLCADESAASPAALERLIAGRCVRIVNIKIQRVGGLLVARAMAERAAAAGMAVWMGTMPELGIATMQAVHLATHPAFTLPSDVHPSARWYTGEITTPTVCMDRTGFTYPAPWTVDTRAITEYRVREQAWELNLP